MRMSTRTVIEMYGNFVTLALSRSLMFRMCSSPIAPVPIIAKRRSSVDMAMPEAATYTCIMAERESSGGAQEQKVLLVHYITPFESRGSEMTFKKQDSDSLS